MARLNDPPAVATESVDALKRRFLRQNRDLAKTNSIQSVRIRCLESEVSRLLAENLELREELLQLRNSVESCPPSHAVVNNLRERLENKLHEISSLVLELGDLPRANRSARSPRKEPLRRPERNLELEEEMLDGRLPTIKENKQWPRLSLNVSEAAIQEQELAVDSPELGSPPVAQFRDEESFSYAPEPLSVASPDEEEKDPEPLPEELSLNVETRRRRRDSGKMSSKRVMVFNSSPTMPGEAEELSQQSQEDPVSRTSRKRKLSERLGERNEESSRSTNTEKTFPFSVKTSNSAEVKQDLKSDIKIAVGVERSLPSTSRAATERRALSSKPVNTDPVLSPKKARTLLTDKPLKKVPSTLDSREAARQRIRDRRITKEDAKALLTERRPSVTKSTEAENKTEARGKTRLEPLSKAVKPLEAIKNSTTEQLQSLPPKTPAAFDDIFSPESQASTLQRLTAKDTPPPCDLSASTTTEPAGRAARRSRPAINYAEPNLVSKMRRPTKELMDAVGKDGRPLQGAIINKQDIEKPTSQWKPAFSASAGDVAQRDEAPSPLGGKSSSQSQSSHVDMQSQQQQERRSVTVEDAREAELAIFDFTDSSPSETKIVDVVGKSNSSRRHSSIGSDRAKEKAEVVPRPSSRSSLGRRKSMMV